MLKRYNTHLFTLLLLLCLACEEDLGPPIYTLAFEAIPVNRYNDTDPFAGSQLYGTWEVIGTSGGFAGQGYTPDFDRLLLKPNGIFGIVRNDSLIATGELRLEPNQWSDERMLFITEEQPDPPVHILWDNEKWIKVNSNTLRLNSFCCDRFDTELKRVD